MSAKLRVVDVDSDRTVMVEPSVSTWRVGETYVELSFWTAQEWAKIPRELKPKGAKRQGSHGWTLLSPVNLPRA